MSRDPVARIQHFNRLRDPGRFAMKLVKMRASPFAFFRGSCHLFYEDWPKTSALNRTPLVWVTGDLHLENFGAFKGANGLAYFDLNDFDEATRAPAAWELARFLTSVHLAATEIGMKRAASSRLCADFVETYRQTLVAGKALWIEPATASGAIRSLLDEAALRPRRAFLDHRTQLRGERRRIILDGVHAQAIGKAQRARVERVIAEIAQAQGREKFFRVIDAATRIAGTGSLGVERYVILVRGKGSPDHNSLLDLKQAGASSLQTFLGAGPHRWPGQAGRVIAIQTRMQAVSPAFLSTVKIGARSFVLRELQPIEDRVAIESLRGEREFEALVRAQARIVAWAQLRSGGRDGSAIADELIAFGRASAWVKPLLQRAANYCKTVEADWKRLRIAVPVRR